MPDPLSAGLMTMSVRFRSCLMAFRSNFVKLSRIRAGFENIRSCSTAFMKASRAASLPLGGVQDPLHLKGWVSVSVVMSSPLWKNSLSRMRLAKSLMSACTSDQFMD